MQIQFDPALSTTSTFESPYPRPKPKNTFTKEEDELLLLLASDYKVQLSSKIFVRYSS